MGFSAKHLLKLTGRTARCIKKWWGWSEEDEKVRRLEDKGKRLKAKG